MRGREVNPLPLLYRSHPANGFKGYTVAGEDLFNYSSSLLILAIKNPPVFVRCG